MNVKEVKLIRMFKYYMHDFEGTSILFCISQRGCQIEIQSAERPYPSYCFNLLSLFITKMYVQICNSSYTHRFTTFS